MVSVLFVCMGNICRSPSAEAVFRRLVTQNQLEDRIHMESAGTHGFHSGETADDRSLESAKKRGFDLSAHIARQIRMEDFEKFDYVLAMDQRNHILLKEYAPDQYHDKIRLFMEFAEGNPATEVPDPYYGGDDGFEHVLDLVQEASEGLLQDIREKHLIAGPN